MKKYIKVIAIMFVLLTIQGCWNYSETDETAFILTLGVDKGENDVLELTAQIAVPKNIAGGEGGGGGGGGGGSEPTEVVSVETPTILSGLDIINSFIERRASLKHTKAIVFSDELAREDMGRYLAPLVRYREFRRNTFLTISKGKAKDFIKEAKPILADNPAKYMEMMIRASRYTGFAPQSQMNRFYNAAKTQDRQPVALLAAIQKEEQGDGSNSTGRMVGEYMAGEVPREGGNKMEIMGAAVFKGGKMVGSINGSEATIMEMIKGRFREGTFTIPDPEVPNKYILLDTISERDPEIKISFEERVPLINVEIPLEAEFTSIQSNMHYERPEAISKVENAFEKRLKNEAEKLVTKTQQEFEADIFGFGRMAKRNFLTWSEWDQYNWLEVYPRAKVNVSFDVNIRRIGLLRESSPIQEE